MPATGGSVPRHEHGAWIGEVREAEAAENTVLDEGTEADTIKFRCDICNEGINRKADVQRHKNSRHFKQGFRCPAPECSSVLEDLEEEKESRTLKRKPQ
ncbi:hypothetical protein FA95DRAFT_1559487 [Auriscalpium vulgare]|uniref:Uncharacterized protein n=1 Tax=Auriscalpium vulgare TaxID=40419 RepID=A0ACB8RSA2_9AGAM|nr:hypothetical protein FA95DRAFT_1559487 [Auriscalpium vulgare]